MKNVQVIDGAQNSEYAIFAMTDEEFAVVFPDPGQNVEFIEDAIERTGKEVVGRLLRNVWKHPVRKPEANGIHGTLFYELLWKKKFYPTKNDTEMVPALDA